LTDYDEREANVVASPAGRDALIEESCIDDSFINAR